MHTGHVPHSVMEVCDIHSQLLERDNVSLEVYGDGCCGFEKLYLNCFELPRWTSTARITGDVLTGKGHDDLAI